jgi:Flp pilus assembly protein TadD
LASAGNDQLTGTAPAAAGREAAEMAIVEGGSLGSDEANQLMAGVAPGLALTTEDEADESSIDPFGVLPARETQIEIDQFNRLAVAKLATGEYPAALRALRRTLALAPNSAAAHGNLALALWRSKQPTLAEIHCRRAIILDPNYVRAHRMLVELLRQRGAPDALASYRRLLALEPGNFVAHNNVGLVLAELGRRSEADAAFARALELSPGNPYVRFNQLQLQPDGDLTEAADCCRRALEQRPANADTMTNLAVVLQFAGRYDDALSTYEQAIAVDPQHVSARFNLSLLLLLRGDYLRGFGEYEQRWSLPKAKKPRFAQPEWQGENVEGKTILLHSEQGLGDTIMCLRYVPLVAARASRVLVRVERTLVRLATSLPDNVVITPTNAPLPAFDLWCPVLSLPRIFDTRLESIPATTPYLGIRNAIAHRWRQCLQNLSGLKVGLVWAGSPSHINDFRRSIDFARLKPLFDVSDVSFVSLQAGPRATDLAALPPGTMTDLFPKPTDFAETAGAILNLDLVIAVDTSVVHLAGALGRPAWIMLPFSPDWRWMLDRDDSPWYPSLRLYRQPELGDWDSVIARVAADLARLVASHSASAHATST